MKKLLWYGVLFAGLVLSTSFINEKEYGFTDEQGYLVFMGVCLLTAFILEYLIPKLRQKP